MKNKNLFNALIVSMTLFGTAGKADDMTQNEIRQGYLVHAVKAQFHRWFQIYERPDGGIENALDVLSGDISVTSGLGVAKGHEEYARRVQQLPDSWKNAHAADNAQVSFGPDGAAQITADVTYTNVGILEDGGVRQAKLGYALEFASIKEALLPKLSKVVITQNSDGVADSWVDAYPENRTRSLVHHYLAIIEDPARDPEPMRELLADGFSLNFSSGAITDFDGFKAWLAGPASQVAASTHVISDYQAVETSEGTFEIAMVFDWAGLLPDGTELVAKTRHNWVVTNEVTERFARILRADVELLEPFRPKDG